MKFFKVFGLLIILSFSSFIVLHKYYISVTEIVFVDDKKSVQIISRIFTDDIEALLKQRYDESLNMDYTESKILDSYIERYLSEKIKIKINGKEWNLKYIGKQTDLDITKVYMEIENVVGINSIEIINKLLFDIYEDQQNMIKIRINSQNKSYLLTLHNDNALLNFD